MYICRHRMAGAVRLRAEIYRTTALMHAGCAHAMEIRYDTYGIYLAAHAQVITRLRTAPKVRFVLSTQYACAQYTDTLCPTRTFCSSCRHTNSQKKKKKKKWKQSLHGRKHWQVRTHTHEKNGINCPSAPSGWHAQPLGQGEGG